MRRPGSPNDLLFPYKKGTALFKAVPFLWRRGKKRGGGEGSEGLALSGGYALLSLSKPF